MKARLDPERGLLWLEPESLEELANYIDWELKHHANCDFAVCPVSVRALAGLAPAPAVPAPAALPQPATQPPPAAPVAPTPPVPAGVAPAAPAAPVAPAAPITSTKEADPRAAVKAELDALGVAYNKRLGLANLQKLLDVSKARPTVPAEPVPAPDQTEDMGVLFRTFASLYSDANEGMNKCRELAQKYGASKFSEITDENKPKIVAVLKQIIAAPQTANEVIAQAGA